VRKAVIWIIKLRAQAIVFSMQATKIAEGGKKLRCPENKSARLITSKADLDEVKKLFRLLYIVLSSECLVFYGRLYKRKLSGSREWDSQSIYTMKVFT
jgi:hypothetical protein